MSAAKTPHPDQRFARLIIDKGLVSSERVEDCLKAAREMSAEGEPTTLKELLLQYGYLTPEQAEQAEQAAAEQDDQKPAKKTTQFGDYELLAHIGRGGMANVYLARHKDRRGYLALKVLHPTICNKPEMVERLERERRALFTLEHPNIVRGQDFGNIAGRYYLAMEFVEGVTLKSYVKKNGPVSEHLALDWLEQVADALDAAHRSGFVHRDIKTRNLVLRKDGVVKILDFGLSKSFLDEDQDLTQDGQMLGTVLYAAPEQLRGAKNVDCRADIYSLGITLYYLLVGEAPFRGSTTTATAAMHFERPLPDLKAKRPELSDGICKLLERMVRKSPDARYQAPAELLADIRLLRREGRVSDREPGVPPAQAALSGRKTGRVWPLGIAAAIALAAFLAYILRPQPGTEDRPPGESANLPAVAGTSAIPASVSGNAPEPMPGPPGRRVLPQEQFAELQASVEDHLKKGEFLAAIRLFEPFPESLKEGDWLTKAIGLRDQVRSSARVSLEEKRARWLQEESVGNLAETLQDIIAVKLQLPDDLRPEADKIQEQVLSLRRASGQPDEAPGNGPPPDGGKAETAGVGQPSDTAPKNGQPAGVAQSPAQAPKAESGAQERSEQEAERLLSEVTGKARDKDWPGVLSGIEKLRKDYPKSQFLNERSSELAEMHALAKAQSMGVEGFFSGKAKALGGDEIEVFYDFSDPWQVQDWLSLDGRWEAVGKKVSRTRSDGTDVFWWRHPHSSKFHLRFDAQGESYLSCVVAGDGLVADAGTGFVCGLGLYGGNKAAIRTHPKNDLEAAIHQVNPKLVYSVEALVSGAYLILRSGGDVKLKLDTVSGMKGTWDKPGMGGCLRLGLFGWQGVSTSYSNVRIRTALSKEWVDLERGRIRAILRSRAGLLKKNYALKLDGEQSYAIIPPRKPALPEPPLTVELRFLPHAVKKDCRGTLLSFGLEHESVLLGAKVSPEDFQVGVQVGLAKEQPAVRFGVGWHHLAITVDGESATLYMDGRRLQRDISVRRLDLRKEPVLIGHGSLGTFKGLIDDVRLSNIVRYDGVFQPPEDLVPDANTVVLLKFNEGEGNMGFDSGPEENHAYVYGAAFEPVEAADKPSERPK
jgi:serine/threonine-protein kinase